MKKIKFRKPNISIPFLNTLKTKYVNFKSNLKHPVLFTNLMLYLVVPIILNIIIECLELKSIFLGLKFTFLSPYIFMANTFIIILTLSITLLSRKRHFWVTVFSLIWLVKAALPHMQPGSSIITTNSIEAEQPSSFLVDYAGTKAAIKNMTMSLAKQLANRGIRVNSVAPGPIWTPLQIVGGQLPENIPTFGQSTPIGRAGQPAELAGAYVFLASNESSYVTGESINVTGGLN